MPCCGVAALQEELTRHQQIVLTFRCGVYHLHQQALGIVQTPHALVGLRQAAKSIEVVVLEP